MLFALRYGLGFASVLFIVAYILAKKKRYPQHKIVAAIAVIITVITGLALIAMVQIMSAGDASLIGIQHVSWSHPSYILAHRIIASISFIIMLYLAISGLMNKAQLHKKIGPIFLALYLIVYISGLILFEG